MTAEVPQLPAHHVSPSMKNLMLVFAIVLVGALAYLVWASNTAPDTTDNSATTVKKTATATTDETTDWKTYTNAVVKLTFQYPATYSAGEVLPDGKFCPANDAYCSLTLSGGSSKDPIVIVAYRRNIQTEFTGHYDTPNPPVTTLEAYLKDAFAQTDTTLKSNLVLVDGRTSYWVTDPTTEDRTMIYVQVGQALYFFSFDSAATYDKLSAEHKRIISSIKFVN